MNDGKNTAARARCCLSDLQFLLSILPDTLGRRMEVRALIQKMKERPTDEQINAAWKQVAIIHDEIRNAKL